jgi:CMP-2-keto-3-deoxyoctulosonic acid synthetase
MSGSVPAHRTMLEVGGALKGTQTQVNVQQNAPVITPESIKMMEEFLKQKGITDI